mgnify:CR=1 FL=1|jgi:hypothetical protein
MPYSIILRNQLGDKAMENCVEYTGKQIKDYKLNQNYKFIANIHLPDV